MIINTLFYYTCIMNESKKCKKDDSICNNHRVCSPYIKGWYMCMNSSFASLPHFCLQSSPKKRYNEGRM